MALAHTLLLSWQALLQLVHFVTLDLFPPRLVQIQWVSVSYVIQDQEQEQSLKMHACFVLKVVIQHLWALHHMTCVFHVWLEAYQLLEAKKKSHALLC